MAGFLLWSSGMRDVTELMVTFADLERISGMTFRTIRERLKQVTPASSSGKSDFYRLSDALPALYRSDKSEKEQVTIEEIRARTRNWHVTAAIIF